ncbi:EF-hand calcium-binding domain-containing protein 1 [Clonorchis sinensis]|uniref:EF-hand calcium-binding domain-containing protein 1 n=2 Tax=Clonorchis sinensis TaxID=79923 RepID=H2KNX2_CLOSI|nr:EF-hand calcium-binding domain-containing protein 1 [Clonorchis sinensis]GAA41307.2 EF-hand calcium-binding domain-containing protein 1 [Clonorchis sinensis]
MASQQSAPGEMNDRKPSMSILKQRFYRQALKLETKTRFTCIEIEGLLRIFDKLVEKYNSPMTKPVLKDVLFNFFGLTNDIMMDKIFRTMASGKSTMTYEDWIIGMDIYLRGTLKQLANFAFTVYDHQRRDFLSKEDIQMYLKNILAAHIPDEDAEECQTDMLDMVFLLLDRDKDGYVSRKDFVDSVLVEPLLLQILGECLPSARTAMTLNSLVQQESGRLDSYATQE